MGLLNAEVEPPRHRGAAIVAISVAGALVLAGAIWLYAAQRRAATPTRTFDSAGLGCRFEFSSELAAGPNFVRSPRGAFLTIERHSLFEAEKVFVAGLPESLFPQVRIQLDQGYRDLEELSRRKSELGGRPSLHVELRGHPGAASGSTRIEVDIAASEQWVWVLRAYFPDNRDVRDEAAIEQVRTTMTFLPEGSPRE